MPHYADIMMSTAGSGIMSAQNSSERILPERVVSTKAKIDLAIHSKWPVIQKIDVASLQIDEAHNVDGDPYNCTGRFLVDAIKAQYED